MAEKNCIMLPKSFEHSRNNVQQKEKEKHKIQVLAQRALFGHAELPQNRTPSSSSPKVDERGVGAGARKDVAMQSTSNLHSLPPNRSHAFFVDEQEQKHKENQRNSFPQRRTSENSGHQHVFFTKTATQSGAK